MGSHYLDWPTITEAWRKGDAETRASIQKQMKRLGWTSVDRPYRWQLRRIDPMRYPHNDAQRRRIYDRFRSRLIALLGMPPEDLTSRDTRYAATTTELHQWAREKYPRVRRSR